MSKQLPNLVTSSRAILSCGTLKKTNWTARTERRWQRMASWNAFFSRYSRLI